MEPSPRALRFMPRILLPLYGWKHQTIPNEMSFRQTVNGLTRTDRGFKIVVDHDEQKILLSFDVASVSEKHSEWLKSVEKRVGLHELDPQPYWGFDDLFHHAGTKLINCFYIRAKVKRENGKEFYWYKEIMILEKFDIRKFLEAIEEGYIFVNFDARTGHNHGTKFRIKEEKFPFLYKESIDI